MDCFNAIYNPLCLVSWSIVSPIDNLSIVIFIGLVIAIASATQDITLDALRIEQIGQNEVSMQLGRHGCCCGGQDIKLADY